MDTEQLLADAREHGGSIRWEQVVEALRAERDAANEALTSEWLMRLGNDTTTLNEVLHLRADLAAVRAENERLTALATDQAKELVRYWNRLLDADKEEQTDG